MACIIDGRRGGKILINDGFIYQKNKTGNEYIYWRCSSKDYRAPLIDVGEPPDEIEVYDVGNHNHEPSDDIISRQALVNHMKQKKRDDPSVPLRRV